MSGALPWYIARSAGLVAWALLSASVIWGLTMSNRARPFGHRPRPAWMLDLHRWLGGLATIFVGVHIVAILLDRYVNFSIVSVLVPFAASWRNTAVAWGVVAMWLLLAVELTSLARRRLPRKAWRLIHGASFPLFGLATLHAFTAGTDAGSILFIAVGRPGDPGHRRPHRQAGHGSHRSGPPARPHRRPPSANPPSALAATADLTASPPLPGA